MYNMGSCDTFSLGNRESATRRCCPWPRGNLVCEIELLQSPAWLAACSLELRSSQQDKEGKQNFEVGQGTASMEQKRLITSVRERSQAKRKSVVTRCAENNIPDTSRQT